MQLIHSAFLSAGLSSLVTAIESNQVFQIPYINAHEPSGRPGNSPYCTIDFTIIDAASNASTSCSVEHGCLSDSDVALKPLPTEQSPKVCNDTSFNFYVPEYQDFGDYKVHVEHGTHEATSKTINGDNYPDGYQLNCGGSGVCNAWFANSVSPIVLDFEN
ncbi:hypothetical protein BKA67DRAFT_686196 [Truncatella angustata]|uniref:Uncharacterized protein n=1 Tax=Truncatella angustata TaxID=152316 RepID=A0A9P8UWI1_9PEZI|nr:uncharacterized protein BKA67DRAFT_686196 [Truncatella angustata]KAH6659698.1 hypothetical protein BKA67DRAFT_686196 [Truncatella angustata]